MWNCKAELKEKMWPSQEYAEIIQLYAIFYDLIVAAATLARPHSKKKSDAALPLQRPRTHTDSVWVHLLSAPGVLLLYSCLFFWSYDSNFQYANAKFNTLKLWLLLQSIWLRGLRVCWNQLPAEERRGVCVCVYVYVGVWKGARASPFTKADIQVELCSVWWGFRDLSLPRVHHNYPFKYFQWNKPHQTGLKLALPFWFPVHSPMLPDNTAFCFTITKNSDNLKAITVLDLHCWGLSYCSIHSSKSGQLLLYNSHNHSSHMRHLRAPLINKQLSQKGCIQTKPWPHFKPRLHVHLNI